MNCKTIIYALLPLCALCSCVKDLRKEDSPSRDIVFNSPIIAKASSKAITGSITDYSTSESFKVWGLYSDSDFAGWDETASGNTLYIPGDVATYDANINDASEGQGGWKTSTTYYWPKSGKVTFAAMSPADASGDATSISYGNGGLKIDGFSIKSEPTQQYDLMYSERALNKNTSAGINTMYDGVDLVFRHALASIKFRFRTSFNYEATPIQIKSVRILNAYSHGDFRENVDETQSSSYISAPAWTNHSELTQYSAAPSTLNQSITNVISDLEGGYDLLLMPQEFLHSGAGINNSNNHVKIEIRYEQGGTLQTGIVDLVNGFDTTGDGVGNDYFYDGGTRITGWAPGKRYIYTITFGKFKILFTPTVIDWNDIVEPSIEI